MFRRLPLRLVAAGVLLAFAAGDALALPVIRRPAVPGAGQGGKPPGGQRGGNRKGKNTKPSDPLTTAIQKLHAAEKDLDAKDGSATQDLRAAEQIVEAQEQGARQARDRAGDAGAPKDQRDHLKARVTALDAARKDIRTAEKAAAGHKADEARTAIQSAITALEGLTGGNKGGNNGKKKK